MADTEDMQTTETSQATTDAAASAATAPTIEQRMEALERLWKDTTQGQGVGKQADPKAAAAEKTARTPQDDVNAAIELGELRAALPGEVRQAVLAEMADLPVTDQVKLLKIAALIGQPKQPGSTTDTLTTTARAAPSAPRSDVVRPRTLNEYMELSTKDPKRKAKLDADKTFDPSTLPRG